MTKKPRRLGRGFSSFLEDNHRPLGGGQCSQQRYLTTSQRAEQINFRLWAGGHFTLRKPLCAYGLIAQPVQLSALPGRAPTTSAPAPSSSRQGINLRAAPSNSKKKENYPSARSLKFATASATRHVRPTRRQWTQLFGANRLPAPASRRCFPMWQKSKADILTATHC